VSGLLDTNVLLYAVNQDAPEHAAAHALLMRIGQSVDPWYVTDGILYEFLRVSTHPKVFSSPLTWSDAITFVRPIVDADNVHLLQATDRHWPLLEQVLGTLVHPSGNLFFDVRTVVLMREHGVRRIYTTDTDFLQFEGIDVVNPLRA
jgi:toxin-antitoxin system PIN domain toxin